MVELIDPDSKLDLKNRVAQLRLNPDALESVSVDHSEKPLEILNETGKLNSLQIYAEITTNDGFIGPEEAQKGLKIFGEEYRRESRETPGQHRSIELLEDIAAKGIKATSTVVRRASGKLVPEHVVAAIPGAIKKFGTPFHIYDEKGIRDGARRMEETLGTLPGFRNHFAVKALPNPHILKILADLGMGADCSSIPEISTAQKVRLPGEYIMVTSNNTSKEVLRKAAQAGAIINLDDISFIDFTEKALGVLPETLCFRYNPGKERTGNAIIGEPFDAKYGLTKPQMIEAFKLAKSKGVKRFGLHTMVASNGLDPQYFIDTAKMMFDLAVLVKRETGVSVEFVNLGGGIGTPYKPEQLPVDLKVVADGIKAEYGSKLSPEGLSPSIYMENGRCVTGPHGWLVTTVRHIMEKHKTFVGVDAPNAALDRAGRYGAYHHVTVLGKEFSTPVQRAGVVSSLCENVQFAVNRPLPDVVPGDVVLIHNAGAHAHAMANNYNAELAPAEILLRRTGNPLMIRRAETEADLFRTVTRLR